MLAFTRVYIGVKNVSYLFESIFCLLHYLILPYLAMATSLIDQVVGSKHTCLPDSDNT